MMSKEKLNKAYDIAVKVKNYWCNTLYDNHKPHIASISPQVEKIIDGMYRPVVVICITNNSIVNEIPTSLPLLDDNENILEHVFIRVKVTDKVVAC